ncbi:MAG: site-specific integrase [Spirochaetia bacterium]|nr:site-specific integrase [Spirochaetia bacterium]
MYIRNGKGGVDRQSALSGKAIALIRIYLSGTFVRDWLFVSDRKICGSGELFPVPVDHKPMSIRNAQYVYRNIADKLKFPGHTTLHSLRHSFGTHLIEDGLSIFSIQKMMGHQHIRTTLKYWIFKSPVRVF